MGSAGPGRGRSVAMVTLGCARNDVDSQELAGRLAAAGWQLVPEAADADVAVVNTCGFIEQAKKDSIDTLLEVADLRDEAGSRTQAVVAVGCMAQRYGTELAEQLPEADAVLGFDSYNDLASHLDSVLAGHRPAAPTPGDRRTLLPIAPADRLGAEVAVPGHETQVVRQRLDDLPWASLKLASGCDRRCSFCAIPSFRGSYISRPPHEILAEARWLAEHGVKELFLVSENTTSYGKDLGDIRLLESLLPQLVAVDGIQRVRTSYLQPAEMRPGLLEAIAQTPGVAPYFDLSFQHSSPQVLRRMRRFGGTDDFLALIERIRALAPQAGIRSNFIVGFPGETQADYEQLRDFLNQASLDFIGIFGYSDEEGTEAVELDGHLDEAEISARVEEIMDIVDELTTQRAEDRIGEHHTILIDSVDDDGALIGRAEHQAPQSDGITYLTPQESSSRAPQSTSSLSPHHCSDWRPGDWVGITITGNDGVDLIAQPAS